MILLGRRGRRGVSGSTSSTERSILSAADWRQRRIRWTVRGLHVATLVFLLVIGLGPLLWMLKSSITSTQDTLRYPLALWPNGFDLSQFATAWTRVHIDRYLINTLVIALGSWAVQMVVASTAGFALAVLRPRFGRLLSGLVIATLFVPPIVLLVPLYLTVVDVPILPRQAIERAPRPGPLIVDEFDATIVVPPDTRVWRDDIGSIVMETGAAP